MGFLRRRVGPLRGLGRRLGSTDSTSEGNLAHPSPAKKLTPAPAPSPASSPSPGARRHLRRSTVASGLGLVEQPARWETPRLVRWKRLPIYPPPPLPPHLTALRARAALLRTAAPDEKGVQLFTLLISGEACGGGAWGIDLRRLGCGCGRRLGTDSCCALSAIRPQWVVRGLMGVFLIRVFPSVSPPAR